MADLKLAIVVLAAGQGKRMHSNKPKVLHEVLGEPMLGHVLRTAQGLSPHALIVVTGHGRMEVEPYVQHWQGQPAAICVEQVNPNGTGHAVLCAQQAWEFADEVLVLYGDVPLLQTQTLRSLLQARGDGLMSLLAANMPDPTGYGRVILNEHQRIAQVVEHKDASAQQRQTQLCNAGMVAVRKDFLLKSLQRLRPNNAQGELYLTDLLAMAAEAGEPAAVALADCAEIQGVNNRAECALATSILRKRINAAHMLAGVALQEPETTWIEATVALQADCQIAGGVELRGHATVAGGALIERGCVLRDTHIGEQAHLLPYTVATDAVIGARAHVGPFAHLRPGTILEAAVKIGNFVETKKAHFGRGAKASHLSYIGDAEIGADCNIGAGTITCNYDGVNKFKTTLGDGVFIGSDSQLVAPVTLGDGAYVGAGTTVTRDVPAGALAISRTDQRNIEGWTAKKRERQAVAKTAK